MSLMVYNPDQGVRADILDMVEEIDGRDWFFDVASQFVPVWYGERDARQRVRATWVQEHAFLKAKEDAPPPCVWLGRGCREDVCKCVYCEVLCGCHEMASISMFTCKWCAADWQAGLIFSYVAKMCRK